jgi:hypothetical protein
VQSPSPTGKATRRHRSLRASDDASLRTELRLKKCGENEAGPLPVASSSTFEFGADDLVDYVLFTERTANVCVVSAHGAVLDGLLESRDDRRLQL